MDAQSWPLFGLAIRTPLLGLHVPTDAELAEVIECARDIHDGGPHPFNLDWSLLPESAFSRGICQFHWSTRSGFSADEWNLPFVCFVDGRAVGAQSLFATGFPV